MDQTVTLPDPAPMTKADPAAIRHAFESGKYPYNSKIKRDAYEKEKAQLQAELLKLQLWAKETGESLRLQME